MKTFTANEETNLKDFTDSTYPQGSFYFSALLKKGDIRVNGTKQKANCPLHKGDTVVYYTTPSQESKPSHEVVYDDESIIIADKYSGVSSEALFFELKEKCPYPVHRLDRNTSGLIVLAKSEKAQEELKDAFKERSVEKVYHCLAKNSFKTPKATLTAYLEKDEKKSLVRIYASPNANSVKIITEYEVIEERGDIALVKIILHTGKTHQIRAHLSFIGCPVLGDNKYGDERLNKKYKVARQCLVAKSLSFTLGGTLGYLNDKSFSSGFDPELPKN
ncbi:MAG: RluA family pseudouridine synthase [Clostridia bacterium]|nr:RluA family pseudouridine synthase [Clostridia bacterium]